VVVSWLAIIVYLWIRFGRFIWGFAAVICLIHDSLIVLGFVAFSTWIARTFFGHALLVDAFKIDLSMVAAVLTIIGYSVNDTIVVFDRIRENRGKLSYVTRENINTSINQTLSRTILTAGTVFMVCIVMYIFGGDGIHGFNYAMLIGTIVGCYSSIAIASPLLIAFKRSTLSKALALAPERESKGSMAGK
jgi:SecD/SecF fusion protein